MESTCRTCWWLSDEYTSVCVNESSPHCADFVLLNQSCPYYDMDEGKVAKYGHHGNSEYNERYMKRLDETDE